MSVLVVGSIALDTVKTPVEEHADLLGGSASYAAVGASFFSGVQLVGVVGEDFPPEHVEYFGSRRIDLAGLQRVPGKTFRWSGEYHWDLNTRETRSVELNVFEHFTPALPAGYRETGLVLLANIAPALQSHVLDQMARPRFVIADTMDLWIDIAKADLLALLQRVDMLILNDGEARQLTGETSLVRAGAPSGRWGRALWPSRKGSMGACSLAKTSFSPAGRIRWKTSTTRRARATPSRAVSRATWRAWMEKARSPSSVLRKAVVYGSVLASFNVEAFSLERLRTLTPGDIEERYGMFKLMSQFEALA